MKRPKSITLTPTPMATASPTTPWCIIIDRYEFKVARFLPEYAVPAGIALQKKRRGAPLDGDFIICYNGAPVIAFERKSEMDMYNSIIEERLDGQVSRLLAMYPVGGFILEESGYFPKRLRTPRHILRQLVRTKTSEYSMRLPTLLTTGPRHTAYLLCRLITEGYIDATINNLATISYPSGPNSSSNGTN